MILPVCTTFHQTVSSGGESLVVVVEGSVPCANAARPVDVGLWVPCSSIVSMCGWTLAIANNVVTFGHYVVVAGHSQSHDAACGGGKERRFANIAQLASSK